MSNASITMATAQTQTPELEPNQAQALPYDSFSFTAEW